MSENFKIDENLGSPNDILTLQEWTEIGKIALKDAELVEGINGKPKIPAFLLAIKGRKSTGDGKGKNMPLPSGIEIFKWFIEGLEALAPSEKRDELVSHCFLVANAAKKIAEQVGMCPETAYVMGLLHDVTRVVNPRNQPRLLHAITGYKFLIEMGYPELARICITHCFTIRGDRNVEKDFNDLSPENAELVKKVIDEICELPYTEWDLLIQLADTYANDYDTAYLSPEKKQQQREERFPDDVEKIKEVFAEIRWRKNYFLQLKEKCINAILKKSYEKSFEKFVCGMIQLVRD